MSPSTFGARNTHFKQIQISSTFICKTASDEIALLAQGHKIVYALLIFIGKTGFLPILLQEGLASWYFITFLFGQCLSLRISYAVPNGP